MANKAIAGLAALALFGGLQQVAQADLISNGGFETLTSGLGQIGYNTNATGWTTTGYTFVFGPGTADTTGVKGQYGSLYLWGPNGVGSSRFSSNGLPATSPDGGNFLAADGAFQTAPITQTISGLTIGRTYMVGFDWAAAQQSGFNGLTTDQWKVSLGSSTQYTPVAHIASHGFSGWQTQTFNYVATSGSEVLSFLAIGTPNGTPPFALLDQVTMQDVQGRQEAQTPEPTAAALMAAGIIGCGVFVRRRSQGTIRR